MVGVWWSLCGSYQARASFAPRPPPLGCYIQLYFGISDGWVVGGGSRRAHGEDGIGSLLQIILRAVVGYGK